MTINWNASSLIKSTHLYIHFTSLRFLPHCPEPQLPPKCPRLNVFIFFSGAPGLIASAVFLMLSIVRRSIHTAVVDVEHVKLHVKTAHAFTVTSLYCSCAPSNRTVYRP